MKVVTVRLPENLLEILDTIVSKKIFSSRSEAIRVSLRRLILELAEDSKLELDLRTKLYLKGVKL